MFFDYFMFCLWILCEMKFFWYFNYENIIFIFDIQKFRSYELFNEVYFIQVQVVLQENFILVFLKINFMKLQELMEIDMYCVICIQEFLDDYCQYFIYQMLCVFKVMYFVNVFYCDLKFFNLFFNVNCDFKVCDFGLVCLVVLQEDNLGFMIEYVVICWYCVFEIMLIFKEYIKVIDVWLVGCIFVEMFSGKFLFLGKDCMYFCVFGFFYFLFLNYD